MSVPIEATLMSKTWNFLYHPIAAHCNVDAALTLLFEHPTPVNYRIPETLGQWETYSSGLARPCSTILKTYYSEIRVRLLHINTLP